MAARVMIDIECYGKAPSGRIASIGAYAGRTYSGQELSFYRNIDQRSMDNLPFTSDAETLAWWARQSEEARAALEPNQVSIGAALVELSAFIDSVRKHGLEIWAKPPCYDLAILRYAYRAALDQNPPWHWRAERCFRTLVGLGDSLGVKAPKREGTWHNALDDAKHQYEHMQAIMQRITGEGRLL